MVSCKHLSYSYTYCICCVHTCTFLVLCKIHLMMYENLIKLDIIGDKLTDVSFQSKYLNYIDSDLNNGIFTSTD